MKHQLIRKYFELKTAQLWADLSDSPGLKPALIARMMRIDLVLFERYGYDVSLTRKFN